MGHQHSGNYSAKHPLGTPIPEPVLNALKSRIRKGEINCKAAHSIAQELSIAPEQIGIAIDLCNARITACQLGLFPKSAPPEGVQPTVQVSPELKETLQAALTDNRLACIRAWQVGDTLGISRPHIGKVCEILGLKIYQCQLGAF